MKPKPQTGIITKNRPSDTPEDESSPEPSEELVACAGDLISAIQSNDAKATAKAWNAMFEMRELSPHDEASHDEEEN